MAISANHGHSLAVAKSDTSLTVAKTYSIAGAAGHDHLVKVTPAMFTQLRAGKKVSIKSTNTFGHTHTVTVSC